VREAALGTPAGDQMLLTAGLLLVRIALQPTGANQVAAVSVVLLLSLGWRGPLWGRLPRPCKVLANGAALLRFLSLALASLGAVPPVPPAPLLALDLALILSR
jgi:hypothetical protein